MDPVSTTLSATPSRASILGGQAFDAENPEVKRFGIKDFLGGTASTFAGIGAMQEGFSEARELELQARSSDIAALSELSRGQQEAAGIISSLNSVLSQQNVALGASGSTFSGSAQAAGATAERKGEREASIARNNARLAFLSQRLRSERARRQAKSSRIGGVVSGVVPFFDFGSSIAGR